MKNEKPVAVKVKLSGGLKKAPTVGEKNQKREWVCGIDLVLRCSKRRSRTRIERLFGTWK